MNAEFEALKARFKQKIEDAGKKKSNFNTDIYPFWDKTINFGEEVLIRILRDSDENNENVFYVEKCIHTLSVNGKDRNVTCIEKHFGEKCPICELSRKFYKAQDKTTGLYYYNKKKFMVKALVIKDPLPPDKETKETSEGKVKVFQMNKKLIDKILLEMATELDAPPWDFKEGYNFTILKMKGDGGNPDYTMGSKFVRKPTAIPQAIVDTLEPTNLASLLPTNPGIDYVQRLLNSHLTGDDDDAGGDDGDDDAEGTTPAPAAEKVGETFVAGLEAAKAEAKVEPKVETETTKVPDEDDEIFARILARKNQKATA